MVECDLPKVERRVRFPYLAPMGTSERESFFVLREGCSCGLFRWFSIVNMGVVGVLWCWENGGRNLAGESFRICDCGFGSKMGAKNRKKSCPVYMVSAILGVHILHFHVIYVILFTSNT